MGKRSAERRKVNVLKMKCLRSLVEVSGIVRVWNEELEYRKGAFEQIGSEIIEMVWIR